MIKIKKPVLITLIVCLGLFVISLPFVLRNQIYDTVVVSSDIKAHSDVISSFTNGEVLNSGNILYPAQVIFGAIIGYIGKVIPLSSTTLYMMFMVLVMA
jgi:hypothetical protein